MKKYALALFTFLFVSVGCTDRDDNVSAVNIRIKNDNSFTYDRVQVGADDKIHEILTAGSYSDYLEYETAYSYAFIQIDTAATSFVSQPVDFVGETPLGPGFYTYELKVDTAGEIGLNFVRE